MRRGSVDLEGDKDEQISFEAVLDEVGNFGKYQFQLLGFFFLVCLFNSYITYAPVFFLYVPEHKCAPYPNATYVWMRELVSKGIQNQTDSCRLERLDNSDSGSASNSSCPYGWTYNFDDYFTSAATDMNWVCEDSWKGPFTQSMFFVGVIVGTPVFGHIADIYGRIPAFLSSNILAMLTGLFTPLCSDFISFSIIRFLNGLSYDQCTRTFFLLALECFPVHRRSMILTMGFGIGFTCGVYLPWLIKYLGDWKTFQYIVFGQMAVVLLTPIFFHESIRWLASQGNESKSKDILLKIAKTNGKSIHDEFMNKFNVMVVKEREEKEKMEKVTLLDLFKKPQMRKNSIVAVIVMMVTYGTLDAHIRNTSNLTFSFYITFTVAGLMELPANLAVAFLIEKAGRRLSVLGGHVFAGITMILAGILHDYSFAVSILTMLGRFFIVFTMTSCMTMCGEVFPTCLRSRGMSLICLFSGGSQFFSPYIVYSGIVDPSLPFYILGTISLLVSGVPLLLPEMTGQELPDTIEQVEKIGQQTKPWANCGNKKANPAEREMECYDNHTFRE